jgi:hypothetical protein
LPDHRRDRPVAGRALLAALVALLGICLVPAAAAAERVGVVVTVTLNTRAQEARRLADALGSALLDQLDIDVVAGREAERRLPPGGVPDTCVVDSACQQDVGRRLDADQLLLLAVVRVGARVQIDATWVNVATGRTASRPRILLHDGQSPSKVFADAVFELMPDAALRMGAGRRRAGERTAAGDQPASGPAAELAAPAPRHVTTGVWIAGGLGAGALLASGVFAADAMRRHRDLDASGCADTPCSISDIDAVDTRARVADVLLGVGVIAGVTAVVLYWQSGAPGAEQTAGQHRPRLDVVATDRSMSLTWGGSF